MASIKDFVVYDGELFKRFSKKKVILFEGSLYFKPSEVVRIGSKDYYKGKVIKKVKTEHPELVLEKGGEVHEIIFDDRDGSQDT